MNSVFCLGPFERTFQVVKMMNLLFSSFYQVLISEPDAGHALEWSWEWVAGALHALLLVLPEVHCDARC